MICVLIIKIHISFKIKKYKINFYEVKYRNLDRLYLFLLLI